jgi:molybdenum cofactor cytidylyltransferase
MNPLSLTLARALRIGSNDCVAFVGSGGKTSAMFRVARELISPVYLSVSTHMASSQAAFADRHIIVNEDSPGIDFMEFELNGLMLFTGPSDQADRVAGLSFNTLEKLAAAAKSRSIPLLIEADGSRLRPLKAPAGHEPNIPQFVDRVVVVAGLAGLNKPLNEEWVHRPDLFAQISGAEPGELITAIHISRALNHSQGGMKNIPRGVRRLALLNQADTQELQSAANLIAGQLIPSFEAVIVSSLKGGIHREESARDFTQGLSGQINREVFAVHERIAGIILAAGASSRIGKPKPLLNWKGEPFIRHVVQTAFGAGLSPVVLVTGADGDLVREAVGEFPLTIVNNLEWATGQASSVKLGVNSLPGEVGGAVFLLVDQPQIPATLVRALIQRHAANLSPIVAPLIDAQRGNPVLFDRSTFPDLLTLEGDTGGRGVFSRYSIDWVEWQDTEALLDIDTDEDYQRLQTFST